MMQSRTHNCGELRLSDAGKSVTIVGWLENVREVGANFAFCVLRDFYGTTQVVIETEEMMKLIKPINKESTISVTGLVRERESKNPKLPTGEIEVVPEKIEVLGKCIHNQLPFEINKSKDADENTRLKYRFLDLRNPAVKSMARVQSGDRRSSAETPESKKVPARNHRGSAKRSAARIPAANGTTAFSIGIRSSLASRNSGFIPANITKEGCFVCCSGKRFSCGRRIGRDSPLLLAK